MQVSSRIIWRVDPVCGKLQKERIYVSQPHGARTRNSALAVDSGLALANMAQSSSSTYADINLGAGAKWVKKLTQDRLNTFTGGHFGSVNLTSVLFTDRLDDEKHVQLQVWSAPGLTKPTFKEAMKAKFKSAKKGDKFGPSCEC
jgi:hypothetical protein